MRGGTLWGLGASWLIKTEYSRWFCLLKEVFSSLPFHIKISSCWTNYLLQLKSQEIIKLFQRTALCMGSVHCRDQTVVAGMPAPACLLDCQRAAAQEGQRQELTAPFPPTALPGPLGWSLRRWRETMANAPCDEVHCSRSGSGAPEQRKEVASTKQTV